ncbi:MAG: protein kinase domain-containing protein [Kofleriaceae bacterium]
MSAAEAFGPYLVYERLGVGGMAQVHRAELKTIEGFRRSVALKRMLPHVAANRELVQAFVREARLASHLRHANVAQTYELGKVDDIYFIAMELITGHTLREVLRRCAATTGPMPVPIALNLLSQICDALDYAHNLCDETGQPLGIIHRDVSPSNIIVSEGGVLKLIDFGIAKASAAGMQTMSGTIKGKFAYMAPEYLAGRIDARADLFAVGVIAHELLTNRPLFAGEDDMETVNRVRSMPIAPPSHRNPRVPPEIDDIVMTALARDPDARWQHATALRNAVTTLTRRLELDVHNQQVVAWLDRLFGEPSRTIDLGDEPSILIQPETPTPGASAQATLMMAGRPPAPPAEAPAGTPAHAMTAQRSIEPSPPPSLNSAEYRAAVAAYESHGIATPPPGSLRTSASPATLPHAGPVPTHSPAPASAQIAATPAPSAPASAPIAATPAPPAPVSAQIAATPAYPAPVSAQIAATPAQLAAAAHHAASPSGQLAAPRATLIGGASAPAMRPRTASQAPPMVAIPASSAPPITPAAATAPSPVPPAGPADVGSAERRSPTRVVVLVLVVVAIAAAAVYFALPHLT